MSRHYREAVLEPLDDCVDENEIPGYPGYYATEEGAILRRIQRADESDVETAKRDTGAVNANKVLSGERNDSLGYTFGYLDDD